MKPGPASRPLAPSGPDFEPMDRMMNFDKSSAMPARSRFPSAPRRAGGGLALFLAGMLASLSTGCSGGASLGNLFGDGAGKKTASVYYASQAGTKLYAKPSFTSAVIGSLSLHQKVVRSQLDHGFAYVEVVGSGKQGWVENAKLIWKIPATAPAAAASPAAPADGSDEGADQPVEAAAAESPDETAEQAPGNAETVPVENGRDSSPPQARPASGVEADPTDSDPSLFNPF